MIELPAAVGGGGAHPSPGWFLRAAVATCVASLATMRAAQLGLAGFTTPVDATVLLHPQCFGQFCGRIGPGDGWLLFARPSGTGLNAVTVDPCGAWAFDGVAQATLDTLAECLRGRAC